MRLYDVTTTLQVAARTCYACATCQPRPTTAIKLEDEQSRPGAAVSAKKKGGKKKKAEVGYTKVFHSKCARESLSSRLHEPGKLRVAELREVL